MKLLLFLFTFLSISAFAGKKSTKPLLKEGEWSGKLIIDKEHNIPFRMVTSFRNEKEHVYIYNGSEEIELEIARANSDSIRISFIQFHSELLLKKHSKHKWIGSWHNYNKKNYAIPCELNYGYTKRFHPRNNKNKQLQIHGKWECTFEPNTIDSYKAIGLFDQRNTDLSGTFLTETGDYRFLEGNVYGDSLYLSCFDGSHAYLFQATMIGDTLKGQFFSGKHWRTTWLGVRNEKFELTDPETLTKVVQPDFQFTLPDLSGTAFTYPNEYYTDKVTLIQIMGTWCPNCMDETKYFKTLYDTYHNKGLEIIAIGYEIGDTFEDYSAKIKRLQTKLNLPFTFLVGGAANKNLAAQHFSMLDHIVSFPTTIYLDKKGQVRKVYTGFNGPGTGKYFTDYKKETEEFLEKLLAE